MNSNLPSVSIITITQYGRFESFQILCELIQLQTYTNIQEWIIVEGSSTLEQSTKNIALIEEFLEKTQLSINCIKILPFYAYTEMNPCTHTGGLDSHCHYCTKDPALQVGKPLGELRNIGNSECTCDVIVCMDDDDYYPPTRVSHAVETIFSQYSSIEYMIGGSSILYIYDFFLDKLYKYDYGGAFGPYHSTNNCMAFKREYLQSNQHDKTAVNAEERSFTKNFTNEMVELDPLQSIICISHSSNTFNKRNLCIGGSLGIYQYMKEINEPITNYIPQHIYNQMKTAYYKTDADGPFTIEYLLKTQDKNVQFLEKHVNTDFELKCKIRNMILE